MQYPDLRHHACDRIAAGEVMKLDLHEVELHATRGEPGVIDTRKPRRAAPGPTKRAIAGKTPEDAALYRCHCGNTFTAAVTTCVACPRCGTGHAW